MDLNILTNDLSDEEIKNIIKRAFDFGYECIALNTFMDISQVSAKKITVPDPKTVDFKVDPGRKFHILNRLTAIITDGMHIHLLLNAPSLKKYDILAFQPMGEVMLRKVCEFEVDIVSLNLSEELGFNLKKTHVGPLINRGKCFEITYAPCLKGQIMKRLTISNAQLLVEVTKAKNVFLSSGASKPLELRSVEDVQNLGSLFGLKKNEAQAAVRKTGQLVLSHARTRTKTGCGFVSITGIYNLPKHQGWIIQACKVPKAETTFKTAKKHLKDHVPEDENVVKKIKVTN